MVISPSHEDTQGTIAIKLEPGQDEEENYKLTTEYDIIKPGDVLTGTIETKHKLDALSISPHIEFLLRPQFCLFNCYSENIVFSKIKFTKANDSM